MGRTPTFSPIDVIGAIGVRQCCNGTKVGVNDLYEFTPCFGCVPESNIPKKEAAALSPCCKQWLSGMRCGNWTECSSGACITKRKFKVETQVVSTIAVSLLPSAGFLE
jgi:hypothetical protein